MPRLTLSKNAGSESWEHDVLDKEREKLQELFLEFVTHRKSGNRHAATQIGETLLSRISDYTSELVKLFNMDSREHSLNDAAVERTIEKLKIWNDVLKVVREYVRTDPKAKTEKGHSSGPFMIRKKKPEVVANNGGGKMLVKLYKLAYMLDKKGEYGLSNEIDEVIKTLAERVGLDTKEMVSLANYFDEMGETKLANQIDQMIKDAAKKAKEKEDGAEKPPKLWVEEQAAKIKKNNPEYSKKKVLETVKELWNDSFTDAKRKSVCKKYSKK